MKENLTDRSTALALPPRTALATDMGLALHGPDSAESGLHFRDLLRIFLKRKWTIVTIFLLSAVISVVLTYLAAPLYRASMTIQIERLTPQVLNYKEVTPVEGEYYDTGDFYYTNYELLKSRAVAERAADDLGLKGAAAAPDAPARMPVAPSAGFLREFLNRLRGAGPPAVSVDANVLQDNAIVGAIQGSLTVEPVRRSKLVRLHFDSTDPFFAAKAVNTVAQAFININLERRFEASAYAKTFLEEKLLQTKARLEDSERELVSFSRDLEIINLDEKQNINSQNLQEFNAASAKAEQERIRAESVMAQAQENPESLAILQDHRNFQTFQSLKAQKAKLESEYQENLKVYKPAFPRMQQLQGQIAEVDVQLRAELEEIRKSARSNLKAARLQEAQLKEKLGRTKRDMIDLQQRSIRYSILKREVDTNRSLYDGLLQRLKEVGVAGGVGLNNISVVDKAQVPMVPFKPSLSRNVSLGLMIGLLVGLMVAWLLEHMDDSIRFVEDVERETGAPVLGAVPKLKPAETGRATALAMGPHADPTSPFSEAYRSVRTALQFSTASGTPRRLVVTSSSKGEGKSTTAVALAINLAQMGKPVLLLDADLRNPALHKILGVENSHGLSNYLAGSIDPAEMIRPTSIPNLFVMTTGPLPPNPVELLSSMKLLNLLSECEERYAHVVLDGPPVIGIADAIVLCNQVENSVFVIESGRTRRGHAKAALKRLQQAGVHPLGVILTKIDALNDLYGYHSYYYQYARPTLDAKDGVKA
jgi:succinoglycan biosynthesis transport protein ExoP